MACRFGEDEALPGGRGALPGAVGGHPAELLFVERDEDASGDEVGVAEEGGVGRGEGVGGAEEAWQAYGEAGVGAGAVVRAGAVPFCGELIGSAGSSSRSAQAMWWLGW
ncbi:hypothetical protein [Streptomyces sp. NPDC058426]|uniref:hypothetical protein n=1 Tax=Streptomyces sp. NPDC058426 TaxID=3346493 RepID=UPI00365309A5